MPIRIGDNFMRLEIDGKVVAMATERSGGWWEVTYWRRFFDRGSSTPTRRSRADGHRASGERARQQRPGCGGAQVGAAKRAW
jgi:hypothetical protein